MNKEEKEKTTILSNVLLTAYVQALNEEEKTLVSLVIEVPTIWLAILKEIVPPSVSFGELVEAALMEFFICGVCTFAERIQKQYASPRELYLEYIKLRLLPK